MGHSCLIMDVKKRVIFIYLYGFGMWNVVRGRKIVSDVPFWMLAINLVSDAQ